MHSTNDLPVADNDAGAERRQTLLIIDDDSMVGRFISHAGEACGYRSIRTTGMESFHRLFGQERPDAVAVDLCVPGCDGIEVIRFLAGKAFSGKVVIISGMDRRVLDAALRLGTALKLDMAEPIAKPFRVDELARRLGARVEEVMA